MEKLKEITKNKLRELSYFIFIINRNNFYSFIIFIIGCIFYISYIMYLYWNTPFCDTMFIFLRLPEKYYKKALSLSDFSFHLGGHGMLGYNILYLFNTLIFHLSIRFDLIINTIMVIICSIITSMIYHKTIKKRNFIFYFGYIFIIFVMFSPLQGSATGMSVQIRLGITFAFLTLSYSENIYFNKLQSLKSKLLLYILIIFSYFFFGTIYTFSWIASITIVYLFRMIYGRINNIPTSYKNYILEICFLFFCILAYFLFYKISIFVSNSINTTHGNINNLFVLVINYIKFIIISMGSVTLPWEAIADGNINNVLLSLNSIYVTIFTLVALIIYFKTKMWEKTLLPLIMIFYTLAFFSELYLGRYKSNDLFWAYNSWYSVHIKFLFTAVIWIYIYAILNSIKINIFSFIISPKIIKNMSMCLLLITLIPCFAGFLLSHKRAPHVKAWVENMIPYLTGELELTSDNKGYSELIWPYEASVQGINFLKKNNLNVFRSGKKYYKNVRLIGFYAKENNNYWINKNAGIVLVNKTANHFSLNGKYPENFPENTMTVTINNNESVTFDLLPGKLFNIEMDFKNIYDDIYIKINTKYSVIPKDEGWNNDIRELAAIIINWTFSN